MTQKEFKYFVIILVFFIIISYIFSGVFDNLDSYANSLKFKLRGELETDSSAIILYLDNDDINALGGLPLKRNYYALAINILNELGAKVIGLDVALIEKSKDKPEYDEVLIKSIKAKNNVILVSYFDIISEEEPNLTSRLPENVGYKINTSIKFLSGEKLNLPFPELIEASASVGHENLADEGKIPIFIAQSNGIMPAFALEIFRTYLDVDKNNVIIEDSKIILESNKKKYTIPFEKKGLVNLNYTGGTKTLNAIPLVEFLQAYSLYKKGGITDIDVNSVRDKIVIIGIVATGRSVFVRSPFTSQFPGIALHTTFIENALNNRFVYSTPKILEIFLLFLIGILFSYFSYKTNDIKVFAYLFIYFAFYLLFSIVLFSFYNFDLTISRHFITLILLTIITVAYKNYRVRERIYDLETERDAIRKKLREREEKLIKLQDELKKAELENALHKKSKLTSEIKKFEKEVDLLKLQINEYEDYAVLNDKYYNFEGIIYSEKSPMKNVVEFLQKIANTDSPVLILGESGTGKELVARAIHNTSNRANKPFVALNCGALTETLLESELFGYEKGAFTGALKEKPGRFELADGGTIFLDEIAETSEAFQVKLLRVLQEGEFERVGGTETKKVNVRVLAATNQNINQNSGDKKFRQDLYYRLSVFVIHLPPLRERKEDIPVLTKYFTDLENKNIKCTQEVMDLFLKYPFNGNVRELQSIIKRAVVLASSEKRDFIKLSDLPEEIRKIRKNKEDLEETIINSLRSKNFSKNSISETAKELGGMNRGTVAEYFRGYCFKILVEKDYNVQEAVLEIASTGDLEIIQKVNKKLNEYLNNALELVDKNLSFEENIQKSKPKFKNLPQKYHFYLEELIKHHIEKGLDLNNVLDN